MRQGWTTLGHGHTEQREGTGAFGDGRSLGCSPRSSRWNIPRTSISMKNCGLLFSWPAENLNIPPKSIQRITPPTLQQEKKPRKKVLGFIFLENLVDTDTRPLETSKQTTALFAAGRKPQQLTTGIVNKFYPVDVLSILLNPEKHGLCGQTHVTVQLSKVYLLQ